ncbi:MAG: sulfatase [Candidatus Aminicenantales bacterium]
MSFVPPIRNELAGARPAAEGFGVRRRSGRRRTPSLRTAIALILSALAFSVCRPREEETPKIWRLIELLDARGVVQSPFMNNPGVATALIPADSEPLPGSESGVNPFGLKKKITVGLQTMRILFAPPRSVYRFELDLPEGCVFEFDTGIVRDANYERLRGAEEAASARVIFSVVLQRGTDRHLLFEAEQFLPEREEERTFDVKAHRLKLPAGAGRARLILSVRGEDGVFSFWQKPLLYLPVQDGTNVILVSVDTLRADRLGCYGYPRATTARLDGLSADAAVFMRTYAPSSWTLPSHVSLLTGLNVMNHQVEREHDRMDPELPTLAGELKKRGFYCAAMTSGVFVSAVFGFDLGFDIFWMGPWGIFKLDGAAQLGRAASDWLRENCDRNFFLFLHTYQCHAPYDLPEPDRSAFLTPGTPARVRDPLNAVGGQQGIFRPLPEQDRLNASDLYDAEVRYTDRMLIGPLLDTLRETGLYDRTLVIVTSDHGEEFYEHGAWRHGADLYDESLKVPLLIKFPRSRFAGTRVESIVRLTDITPTILREAGARVSDLGLDGRDLVPLLERREGGDREFLAELAADLLGSRIPRKIAINSGRMKLILNQRYRPEDLAFFTAPPPATAQIEVYDLDEDPQEKRNAAAENAALARTLVRRIEELAAKSRKRRVGETALSEELREQLKALGYIN